MAKIFIDANIILGFWSSGEGRIPSELLLPLVDLRSHALITQQVFDEVNRNKLNVFLINSRLLPAAFPAEFPDHYINSKRLAEFNSKLKSIKADFKAIKFEFESIIEKLATEIGENNDLTSRMLQPLFSNVARPTGQQLETARARRERGNPPGKRADPLGDQLSWEQFLDAAQGEQSVWIITRDKDYSQSIDKRKVLNPFLHKELTERGVQKIEVHDNLATAFKSLRVAGIISSNTPGDDKLNQLEKEEDDASYPQAPYLTWPDGKWKCPNCQNINENTGLSAHPSRYGGWSYWARCNHCGFTIDTGEAYDD